MTEPTDDLSFSKVVGDVKMLSIWVEILPLFLVRWLALRLCMRVSINREGNTHWVAVARPDVLIKLHNQGKIK